MAERQDKPVALIVGCGDYLGSAIARRFARGGLHVVATRRRGGLDALVFTAGVGENSPPIRAKTCERLEHLGIQLDPERNRDVRPDGDIATEASPVRIFVLAAREDLTMYHQISRLLKLASPS